MLPLLVGDANPYYDGDDSMALYHLPVSATGGRLRAILNLSSGEYLRSFDRVNLCRLRWVLKTARKKADELVCDRPGTIIMLGRKVATAFRKPRQEMFTKEGELILLPHPSGRCLLWNDQWALMRARELLADFLPKR